MPHTKGEWKVKHSESKTAFNVIGTVPGLTYKIAMCPYIQIEDSPIFNAKEKNEAEANAKLIAAAPDMLDTLKRITVMTNPDNEKWIEEVLEIVQQAISKATL